MRKPSHVGRLNSRGTPSQRLFTSSSCLHNALTAQHGGFFDSTIVCLWDLGLGFSAIAQFVLHTGIVVTMAMFCLDSQLLSI